MTGGLTGFPEAIQATWPQATVQTCVVHLIRAATRNASLQGTARGVCAALKPVYQAANEEAALEALAAFEASELGRRYPAATQDLHRCLGPVYTVPGVPTDAASSDLHHELDRVAELPAAQDLEEPGPVPL